MPSSSGARQAHADVIKNGMAPAVAVDKMFKRMEAIFALYTFGKAGAVRQDRSGGFRPGLTRFARPP